VLWVHFGKFNSNIDGGSLTKIVFWTSICNSSIHQAFSREVVPQGVPAYTPESMKLTITHTHGPRQGANERFEGKAVLTLGRNPGNDLVFQESGTSIVSYLHAKLEIVDNRVIIIDLDSKNGTFVNGKRIRSSVLGPDDEVTLGANGPAFRVAFEKRAPASPAPPAPARPEPAPPTIPDPAPAPPEPPPQGPVEQKLYGQRTVGVMIRQALASLGKAAKSTADIEALVDRKVRRTSARFRRTVVAIVALFVIGSAAAGYFLYRSRAVHVTQFNYGAAAGGAIAAANRHNVFVLAGYPVSNGALAGPLQGFCTAFSVGADLLATNAHCIMLGSAGFTSVAALMNGAAGKSYPVVQWFTHGGYREGALSPDVGLVRVSGTLPTAVVRATAAELSQVAPGVTVFLYGFPGRLNDTAAPEATFVEGDIGRVTGFDLRVGDFGANSLLQHSAFCTSGTSGSPMFDTSGRVIGINAGGYVEDGQALAGYNFGMRIDLLDPLLRQVGAPVAGTQ
jgi:hypothetical protein